MKAATTSLLLLMLCLHGFSQFNSTIDILGGVEYSYRTLSTDSDESNYLAIVKNKSAETIRLNWRAGFNYNKKISNNLYLKPGLRLSVTGYNAPTNTEHFSYNSHVSIIGVEQSFIKDYWFIELPLNVRWEFSEKKITPFIEMGLSSAFYMITRKKHTLGLESESILVIMKHSINKFQIISNFSFGVNCKIDQNLQLFIQPIFRYHLTELWKNPIHEHLYNFGVEIGTRVKIN